MYLQGRPQDLGRGGAKKYFLSDLDICMLRNDMLRMAKPCALLGAFGACPPKNFFLNGAIWCIFGSDFVFKEFKKLPFFYIKNLKIHVEIHINYSCTHMLGNSRTYASCPKKF